MGQTYSMLFPPPPPLTEKNLPDQSTKVFLITGASSGLGLELASILYSHNATVHLAARSPTKLSAAITLIKSRCPTSTGHLHPLILDLSDLTTLKPALAPFLASTPRLDVLFHNAGVMTPPQGSLTEQGHELQLGVNVLAPHLITQILHPLLSRTASSSTSPANSVRVVYVSSSAAELMSPANGMSIQNLDYHTPQSAWHKYGVSKAGGIFLASEYGRRLGTDAGILSLSLDPGGLKTELQRNVPRWQMWLLGWALREPIYGAYTELWAGLAEGLTVEGNQGAFVAPWGNLGRPLRKDLAGALKGKSEGGSGVAGELWEWCEERVQEFV